MANDPIKKRYTTGVAVIDTAAHSVTIDIQKTFTPTYKTSVFIRGPERFQRRILEEPSLAERLPNQFFGVAEIDGTQLRLSNLDGALSRFRGEEIRGSTVLIRRYDRESQELVASHEAAITDVSIGDEVVLGLSTQDLDILATPLPRNNIVSVASLPEGAGDDVIIPAEDPDVITTQFPRAVDAGSPVNIIFGRTKHIPCPYINANDIDQEFDYLIGEGEIEVETVYKDGVKSYTSQAPRTVKSILYYNYPSSDTHAVAEVTFYDWRNKVNDDGTIDTMGDQIPIRAGEYTGFWLHVLNGDMAGQYFKILDHKVVDSTDETDDTEEGGFIHKLAVDGIIADGLGNQISPGDKVVVQEWAPLVNTIYKGRTAIRFNVVQKPDGSNLASITADATRYLPPRKNLLWETEGASPISGLNDGSWFAYGAFNQFSNSLAFHVPIIGPDRVTQANSLSPLLSEGWVEQTVDLGDAMGSSYTFSVWLQSKPNNPASAILELFSPDGGSARHAVFSTSQIGYGHWTRCSVTKTGGWGGSRITCRIMVTESGSGDGIFWCNPQLEAGISPTYYEPVGRHSQGAMLWSYPDTIREILENPIWGLDAIVDAKSFEDANQELFVGPGPGDKDIVGTNGILSISGIHVVGNITAFLTDVSVGDSIVVGEEVKTVVSIEDDRHLTVNFPFSGVHHDESYRIVRSPDWLFLKCQGSLPDIEGRGGTAKDILDELLQVRGLQLRKKGSAWVLITDCPGRETQATLGNDETEYDNILSSPSIIKQSLSETTKKITIGYALDMGKINNQIRPYYPFISSSIVSSIGLHNRFIPCRFIRDDNTADRFLKYLQAALQLNDEHLQVETGNVARNLRVGMLVELEAPRIQPENLLKYSEAIAGTTGWTTSGVSSSTVRAVRGADNLNFTGSKFILSGSGTSISQESSTLAAGKRGFATVWMRADSFISGIELMIGDSGFSQSKSVAVNLGQAWQKVTVSAYFTAGASGGLSWKVRKTTSGAATIYLDKAQLTVDYMKPYVPTTSSVVRSQIIHRIEECIKSNVDISTLTLGIRDEDKLFSYIFTGFPSRIVTPIPTDPRIAVPSTPLDLVVPPSNNPDTAAMWKNIDPDGNEIVSAVIQFRMPEENAVAARVQMRKDGEISWTDIKTIYTTEVAPGQVAEAIAHGLLSQSNYTVHVRGVSRYGIVGPPATDFFTTL